MKTKRFAILLTVAAVILTLGMTGCTGGCSMNGNGSLPSSPSSIGSSGSGSGSANISGNSGNSGSLGNSGSAGNANNSGSSGISGNSPSSLPENGGSLGDNSMDDITGGASDLLDGVTGGDRLPDGSNGSGSSSLPGSSSESSSATTTMGTDFGEIGTLSSKGLDWGPGGPRDEKNRSQGAILYNRKYGKYDALFLAAEEPVVYMTFDEGYENGLTPTFLAILKEKGVKGLFFITYDFANREPELVKQIIAEGHVLGNHSWSHKNYSTLSPKEAAEDLTKLHDYVKENFDYEMKYFRFPSGNFNEQTLAVVQSMGYKSIFWSFAYQDWLTDKQPEPGPSEERLVKAACPGNIYLLHAVSSTNAEIMGRVIDRVRDAGYTWGDPSTL